MTQEDGAPDWSFLDGEFERVFKGDQGFDFVRKALRKGPALVSLETVAGHIRYTAYDGQPYDEKKYRVEGGKWDHEHCAVSMIKIRDGDDYYVNSYGSLILCQEVYERYREEIAEREL